MVQIKMSCLADNVTRMTVGGRVIKNPTEGVLLRQLVPVVKKPEYVNPKKIRVPKNGTLKTIKEPWLPKIPVYNTPKDVAVRSKVDNLMQNINNDQCGKGTRELIYRIYNHPMSPEEELMKKYLEKEYPGQMNEIFNEQLRSELDTLFEAKMPPRIGRKKV